MRVALCVLALLLWAPRNPGAAAEQLAPPATPPSPPTKEAQLRLAHQLEQREEWAAAGKVYLQLLQTPDSPLAQRFEWFRHAAWIRLLALQSARAATAFRYLLNPEASPGQREITIVVGGEARTVKVPDPLVPEAPPDYFVEEWGKHVRYDAAVGLARALAQQGDYARAKATLDSADSLHPLGCAKCRPMARVTFAALSQVYLAAATQTPTVDAAFNRLHELIDGKAWLPLEGQVEREPALTLVAREAQLALGEMLLRLKDPGKAKTFLEAAQEGDSLPAKLARAHLRRLQDVEKRPSERKPEAPTEPSLSTPAPLPPPPVSSR